MAEEDPVEHEIDVHLSKSLAQHLYLLQYPVRPAHMTYDKINHLSARVKPQQKKLEMELSVNTRSANYARSKGEQIALNVDGRSEASGFYNSNMMDKQMIASAPASETTGRYAVGVMKEGELHLTPLNAVLQMRPCFNYLDKADAKMKVDFAAGGDQEGSQDEEEEEAKPVTMRFARQETEEAKARRMASYDYLQKKREEESWLPLRFHGMESGMSESQRLQLFASQRDEVSEFQVPPKEYLNMLMPPTDETEEEKPAMPSNVLSLISLRTMPLPDQVKALLKNAKVIRFSQLMALLPQGTDSVAVIRSLQQVAMLVQGCWVVKSEILYPKDQCSPNSGVSSEHLCRGRDYVMWRFTQSPHVTRKEIASIVKLPAEDVKFILEQVSRIKVHCGWEFLFTFDSDFTSRYPDIVQRQKMLWDAKYQSLCHQLKIPKEHEKKFKDKGTSDMNSTGEKPTRRRRNSSRSSGSSRRNRTLSGRSLSDYSDVEMENVENSVEEDDHVTKQCQPMEIAEGDHVTNGPIQNGAVCDNLEPSPEQLLEIQDFVQEKLHSRFVLTVSELKRLYNMRFSEIPPGHVSGEHILNDVYEKALDKAGAMKMNNQLPPGAREEQIYVLPAAGDKLDPAREVLLKVLADHTKTNKKNYVKAVEDQMGFTLTESEVKQLFKVGFVYVFNLIVGTGALTMPLAFQTAGWLLSLIVLVLLAAISYLTVTFVTETMAIANAKLIDQRRIEQERKTKLQRGDSPEHLYQAADESQPLLPKEEIGGGVQDVFDIRERVELGQMASLFFNRVGVLVFYLCIVLYLYGDLAIYAVAVPKSLRDVICRYKLPANISCGNNSRKLENSDLCWEGNSLTRMDFYRIMVAVLSVTLGPFTFFNVQKTKYLQLFTTVTRWLAFICMVVLTIIRLAKGQGKGHPSAVDISGVPNLFGVCVYSFMCHHSLPSLVTPINNKKGIYKLIGIDFVLILAFYALISFTGIYAFETIEDLYTLNFLPEECGSTESITNIEFIQYFLALFPVFTLSTNFPIISITLRNNLKTMFFRKEKPFSWFTDRIVFPLGALCLPILVAFITDEVEFLVGITGSYAGAGIQYVIPAALVLLARREIKTLLPGVQNQYTSPFKHTVWVILVFAWASVAIIFVTVNHIITKK